MSDFSVTTLWTGGITIFLISVVLLWLGLRAQKRPNLTGNEAMIGETGIVKKVSGFRNRLVVEVRGEFWWSKMAVPGNVATGREVRVTGFDPDDLILIIEPIERG